jgi:uncharacterized protein with HEPN domain
MTPERTTEVYLEDIRSAADSAREFIAGLSREEFLADRKTIFAVVRALEIVGEATKRISEDFKARNPALPWRVMAGMRDKLAHDYFGVNLNVVWSAVTENLPEVESEIRRLLSESAG